MMTWKTWNLMASAVLALLTLAPAGAAEPSCAPGQGTSCASSSDCATNATATLCVLVDGEGHCEVPCVDPDTRASVPSDCSAGETCVTGEEPGLGGGVTAYCRAAAFRMDLNLLDSCVLHFVSGVAPDLSRGDECSLLANLETMLDQDGNREFNILDVDGCVRRFLQEPACEDVDGSPLCADGAIRCAEDADCGRGLYCDTELQKCTRECGLLVDRRSDTLSSGLERTCGGRLKTCHYDVGRCEDSTLVGAVCQVNQDCPSGAYCFLGQCAPTCYRALDCPSSEWSCGVSNQCVPRPKPTSTNERPFDPREYSVLPTQTDILLDPIASEAEVPLLIMDLVSQKPVFGRANAVFGYRLIASGFQKLDLACNQDFAKAEADCASLADAAERDKCKLALGEVKEDCVIVPDEEFLQLDSPFGLVSGAGVSGPRLGLRLDTEAVKGYSPGRYQAKVAMIFSNGRRVSVTVSYEHPSPSGNYAGSVAVGLDGGDVLLASAALGMRLHVDLKGPKIAWNALLTKNNILNEQLYVDETVGYSVRGELHGDVSALHNWPGASKDEENEIPVVGIYAPDYGLMHLVGVIDLPADWCRDENGADCSKSVPSKLTGAPLTVRNTFGRRVRRVFELLGPYDVRTRRFTGMYRETFAGLVPGAELFTLDGRFNIRQRGQDESAITGGLLISAAEKGVVSFPDNAALLTANATAAHTYCGGSRLWRDSDTIADTEAALERFPEREKTVLTATERATAKTALAEYAQDWESWTTLNGSCSSKDVTYPCGPDDLLIFPKLVGFSTRIENALAALGGTSTAPAEALTLDDYFRGQTEFCDDVREADACIEEDALRCGLALYRSALLQGLVDGTAVRGTGHALFGAGKASASTLPRTTDATDGQAVEQDAAGLAALLVLRDHNRFFKELLQTNSYSAGAAKRDAFMAMFRAAQGEPLGQGSAYAYKETKLREAISRYDAIAGEVFGPASSRVLADWPMGKFATRGDLLLKQLHATLGDRMATLLELVDHRRRILKSSGQQDHLFATHVLHQEFLQQVFLFALQRGWQGEQLAPGESGSAELRYSGRANQLLERGQRLVTLSSNTRNPLGMHPHRVYFENSDLGKANWQNYRTRLQDGIGLLRTDVDTALANLKQSLASTSNFKGSLLAEQQGLERELESLCGADRELPTSCALESEFSTNLASCVEAAGGDAAQAAKCPGEFVCDSDECKTVKTQFQEAAVRADSASCKATVPAYTVDLGSGRTRKCVRGRVGALLLEREQLLIRRRQISQGVGTLLRRLELLDDSIFQILFENAEDLALIESHRAAVAAIENTMGLGDAGLESTAAAAEIADCVKGGATNCETHAAAVEARAAADAAAATAAAAKRAALLLVEIGYDIGRAGLAVMKELSGVKTQMENLALEVQNSIADYEAVNAQIFSLGVQVADAKYQADQAARRWGEKVEDLVEALVGSETGELLTANRKVTAANARFQQLLVEAYKLTRAFTHRFNLDTDGDALENAVFEIVTLEDLQAFVERIDELARQYCGNQGLDCDYINNGEVFELSLQKELFPQLRDVVDATSGKVLTVGQQFHNLVTTAFRQRVARAYGLADQLQVPFGIWLDDRTDRGAPKPFMLGPGDCNHVITSPARGGSSEGGYGVQGGTVAINVIGTRLPKSPGIKVELWRKGSDFMRSCTKKTSLTSGEGKTNTYIVGWTPTSALGQLDNAPAFFTQSGELSACINNHLLADPSTVESQDGCFRFFARDRSLGAPDYQLVIPQVDGNQAWLLGEGLAENEKPIIEDVVLYFRYNDRPITAN